MTMTPNTPPGPRAWVSWCTPPHAKGERPSKKYEQSSTAATKDTLVFASGSESQSREMMVVLRRSVFFEGFFLSPSSLSSSSSPSMISRVSREVGLSARLDFEDSEGQSEPPV
jgi:hypothetical protein